MPLPDTDEAPHASSVRVGQDQTLPATPRLAGGCEAGMVGHHGAGHARLAQRFLRVRGSISMVHGLLPKAKPFPHAPGRVLLVLGGQVRTVSWAQITRAMSVRFGMMPLPQRIAESPERARLLFELWEHGLPVHSLLPARHR